MDFDTFFALNPILLPNIRLECLFYSIINPFLKKNLSFTIIYESFDHLKHTVVCTQDNIITHDF